jgi:phage-related protein
MIISADNEKKEISERLQETTTLMKDGIERCLYCSTLGEVVPMLRAIQKRGRKVGKVSTFHLGLKKS